jgi:hypothetical protein
MGFMMQKKATPPVWRRIKRKKLQKGKGDEVFHLSVIL